MKYSADENIHYPIDFQRLPDHIGIIMDGNGRWAKMRGLTRTQGHKQGLESAKAVVKKAADLGIKYITLFTFSTENWKRAADEVGFLMTLIKTHLRAELAFYAENEIRVRHTGDLDGLPPDISAEISWIVKETAHFDKTTVVLAINYGGQNEILRAIHKIPSSETATIDEKKFETYLDIPDLPPVDLLIRTAGEKRISNFLLWQSAYAELYFSDLLWPDWNGDSLLGALTDYQARDRRFGGIK
jgi:undecaprenyl diphosphate synthase